MYMTYGTYMYVYAPPLQLYGPPVVQHQQHSSDNMGGGGGGGGGEGPGGAGGEGWYGSADAHCSQQLMLLQELRHEATLRIENEVCVYLRACTEVEITAGH